MDEDEALKFAANVLRTLSAQDGEDEAVLRAAARRLDEYREPYDPPLGGDSGCLYVPAGTDTDGTPFWHCTTHESDMPSREAPCDKAPFDGRPVGEAFNDPRKPCCGRDAADCDCEDDDVHIWTKSKED